MSTDSSGAILGRADAAGEERSPPAEVVSPRGLADVAAAIERVATLIAADAGQAANASDGLERIADIAFVLHERDIEPSLCDALDAAVREFTHAEAGKEAIAQRSRQAAESLRELARRLNDMIAPVRAGQRPAPAAASSDDTTRSAVASAIPADHNITVDEQMRSEELFANDGREDGPVQAVVSLAEALASFSEAAESGFDPLRHPADIAVAPGVDPSRHHCDSAGALATSSCGAVLLGESSLPPTVRDAVPVDEKLSGEESSADGESQRLLNTEETQTAVAESKALPGSDEDPGDLFEPAAQAIPAAPSGPKAPMIGVFAQDAQSKAGDSDLRNIRELTAPAAAELTITALAGQPDAGTPSAVTLPPRILMPPDNPLAPLLALSEEETIALFS